MKSPAFRLYVADFLEGTADMTCEEVGAYIRLLCHSWSKDGLDDNEQRLSLLAGQCSIETLRHAKAKFAMVEGKLRQSRQEEERVKQAEFSRVQSVKGQAGAKAKSSRGLAGAKPGLSLGRLDSGLSPASASVSLEYKRTTSIPTVEEVVTVGMQIGLSEEQCRQWHKDRAAELWADKNGVDIGNWRAWLTRHRTYLQSNPERSNRRSKGLDYQP